MRTKRYAVLFAMTGRDYLMADIYTVKKVQRGTWQVVRIDNGKVVQRGLTRQASVAELSDS